MKKRKKLFKEVECPDGSIKRIKVWSEIDIIDNNNNKTDDDFIYRGISIDAFLKSTKIKNIKLDIELNKKTQYDKDDEMDEFLARILEPIDKKETQKEARYNAKRRKNGQRNANDELFKVEEFDFESGLAAQNHIANIVKTLKLKSK